jgi:YVTN family beta-propeller protein
LAVFSLLAGDHIIQTDMRTVLEGPQSTTVRLAAAASPRAYVSNHSSDTVSVIDTSTNAVVATVPVGRLPSDLAITPDGAFIYVANQTNVEGIAITPHGAFAYVANFPGSLRGAVSVISTATHTVVDVIEAGAFPWGVAITLAAERGRGRAWVQLCHKGHVIEVAEPAVDAHLKHGDTFPPCN